MQKPVNMPVLDMNHSSHSILRKYRFFPAEKFIGLFVVATVITSIVIASTAFTDDSKKPATAPAQGKMVESKTVEHDIQDEIEDANDADQMIDLSDLLLVLVDDEVAANTRPLSTLECNSSEPTTKELANSIELTSGASASPDRSNVGTGLPKSPANSSGFNGAAATNPRRTIPHGTSKPKTTESNGVRSGEATSAIPVPPATTPSKGTQSQAPQAVLPKSPMPSIPAPPEPFVSKKSTVPAKKTEPKSTDDSTSASKSTRLNPKADNRIDLKSPSAQSSTAPVPPNPIKQPQISDPDNDHPGTADTDSKMTPENKTSSRKRKTEQNTAPEETRDGATDKAIQPAEPTAESDDSTLSSPPSLSLPREANPSQNTDGHNEEPENSTGIPSDSMEDTTDAADAGDQTVDPLQEAPENDTSSESAVPQRDRGSNEEPDDSSTAVPMDDEQPQLLEIEGPVDSLPGSEDDEIVVPEKKPSGPVSSRKQGMNTKKTEEVGNDKTNEVPSEDSSEEVNPNPSTSKPRPKMVKVKPLTNEADESDPTESNKSGSSPDAKKSTDAKSPSDSDKKTKQAKVPEANNKTYVNRLPVNNKIPVLTQNEANRAARVENCLAFYIANPESGALRSPWAVMHAMLPFGVEGEIMVGNKRVNSIQWMCYNGTCRTQKLFTPINTRAFKPNVGGGVQGHEGQFLAMLAQSQVSADYPIVINQNSFTVKDLVRYEMATCKEKTELTFKLMGLSYYIDTNQSWQTTDRKVWSIEKLVKEELAQPIVGAACGGTHRLMALTFAVRQRKSENRPINGQFARAERFVNEFIDYTWTLQNPDGSFSTNWFESRGNEPNMERKVQTTGHILEWLVFTLPDEKLKDPRISKSIDFIVSQIGDNRNYKWPIGPRGHATRALALYQQRMYGAEPGQRRTQMARAIESQRQMK